MSEPTSTNQAAANAPNASAETAAPAASRRKVLRQIGYAAAVAPAMLVLMKGRSEALPACDNPAWQHGLSKKGHSGC